jgi:hypothetical protein
LHACECLKHSSQFTKQELKVKENRYGRDTYPRKVRSSKAEKAQKTHLHMRITLAPHIYLLSDTNPTILPSEQFPRITGFFLQHVLWKMVLFKFSKFHTVPKPLSADMNKLLSLSTVLSNQAIHN